MLTQRHEEERERESLGERAILALRLHFYVSPPGPALCKLGSQECCLLHLEVPNSSPPTFLVLLGGAFPCFLATAILDS